MASKADKEAAEKAAQEFNETHARWAADHIARSPDVTFKDSYKALAATAKPYNGPTHS